MVLFFGQGSSNGYPTKAHSEANIFPFLSYTSSLEGDAGNMYRRSETAKLQSPALKYRRTLNCYSFLDFDYEKTRLTKVLQRTASPYH